MNIEKFKKLCLEKIPYESSLDDVLEIYEGVITNLKYFGDCQNTVDVDEMWDATQMAGVLLESKVVPYSRIRCEFLNGDRNFPTKARKWIECNQDSLDDCSKIVFGLNEHQYIFFIYITEFDKHFFFDAQFVNSKQSIRF